MVGALATEAALKQPIGYVLERFPQLSETFIENELRVLQEMGVDVHVVSLRRPGASELGPTALDPDRLTYLPSRRVQARAFGSWFLRRPFVVAATVWTALRLRSQTMLRSALVAPWVASHFEGRDAAHLHAHFATEAAAVAMPAARLLDMRYTVTAHAIELYLRTRGLCTKLRGAAAVVTVCEYNVEQIVARCSEMERAAIPVVYCGVDLDDFELRSSPSPRPGSLRLLSVGRLVPKKGFVDLIDAVALLRDRGLDVRCDIVGDGYIRSELEARIEERGVGSSVQLLGSRSNAEVRDLLAACDAFVLACVIDETGDRDSMPVVAKEAMAVGVPVVATRVAGIPEMVDEEVGRLAPPNDPASLADAIASIERLGPEERHALGLAGRARVADRFDVWTETAKLAEIFGQVTSD